MGCLLNPHGIKYRLYYGLQDGSCLVRYDNEAGKGDHRLRVLTPTRWTLLRNLRREGPLSVRALSKSLNRDYKNVHTDVKELEGVGLVARIKDGKIMVPWDTVLAEVRLEAA